MSTDERKLLISKTNFFAHYFISLLRAKGHLAKFALQTPPIVAD